MRRTAYVFNYTNPMSMLCRGINQATSVKLVGLCHSVQGMGEYLGDFIGARPEEIVCECAGINHQAWALRFERNGEDAYPELQRRWASRRTSGKTRCATRCS